MKTILGNLWDYHPLDWVVITTNGTVKANGNAVMGWGMAKQAASRYPQLPEALGRKIQSSGNVVQAFPMLKMFMFPVKHRWMEPADPELIQQSAKELRKLADDMELTKVYLTRVGCGNGGLSWANVKPTLNPFFDDRFIVVDLVP